MNQRGYTILELMMVVCIIGVLSMIAMTEYNKIQNRAYVGAAMNDAQVLRKAISMYEAEWGEFPINPANAVNDLVVQLVDPVGNPYIKPPSENNFFAFSYDPGDPNDPFDDYSLTFVCKDHHRTQVTINSSNVVQRVHLN